MALTLEMVIEELSNTCMELDIPFDHIRICNEGSTSGRVEKDYTASLGE